MISVVINADTRPGYLTSILGEGWGKTSLQGVRSIDFLTYGVRQKINFFRGHDIQVVLYIDKHEDISHELMAEIESIVLPCGNNSKVIFKEHNRTDYRWNDKIYIEALKLAEGDYVCHVDQDCNLYRRDECDIVDAYLDLLETYKYICQPWNGVGDPMFHASTRFFICKRETLDFPLIEQSIYQNPLKGTHNPCLEFTLGILAGEGNVLYPPRDDNSYIIFSWARYFHGTLKKLNEVSYDKIKLYIDSVGIHGPNDCVDNPEKIIE